MADLISPEQRRLLRKNGALDKHDSDHYPILKLHIPVYRVILLLTELDPKQSLRGYGLFDSGNGCPEISYINIRAIQEHAEGLMWQLTPDVGFVAQYPISVYAQAARTNGRYTEDKTLLQEAKAELEALAQREDQSDPASDPVSEHWDQQFVVPSRGSRTIP